MLEITLQSACVTSSINNCHAVRCMLYVVCTASVTIPGIWYYSIVTSYRLHTMGFGLIGKIHFEAVVTFFFVLFRIVLRYFDGPDSRLNERKRGINTLLVTKHANWTTLDCIQHFLYRPLFFVSFFIFSNNTADPNVTSHDFLFLFFNLHSFTSTTYLFLAAVEPFFPVFFPIFLRLEKNKNCIFFVFFCCACCIPAPPVLGTNKYIIAPRSHTYVSLLCVISHFPARHGP